ncbi:hypothetical protein [Paludibacterium paludis]|uniref:Motility protein n=1 Tax=Paludibacterium paludis TaxID=1225769 RepID=A0A918P4N6_9NEIS|nr:hypothetical protein [Paludibacterium paludis]GGY19139.1 hypothetical protein GCM10011289_23250 [Paludibacterium paludis]
MDGVSQVGAQTAGAAQVFALNKTREIAKDTVLSLVGSAVQGAEAARASNPAHLGQTIDTRA